MPSKPNYNHQRAERDRAKKALKETKQQEKKAQSALRKSGQADDAPPAGERAETPGEPTP